MSVYSLLAEWQERIHSLPEMGAYASAPELFAWSIVRNEAHLDLALLGDMYTEPRRDKETGEFLGGQTLVIIPAPDTLPVVNALHNLGWKRTDRLSGGSQGWVLSAYLTEPDGGGTLRVSGSHFDGWEDPERNTAIPFFADPPPRLSRGKKFLAAYHAWEAKCRNDEW